LFRKYLTIFRISLIERLTYRSDFLLTSALRLLPMVTTILLWDAVYAGSTRSELGGFRLKEMIAYLLLVHISRMFSSMPGLAGGIALDIREGTLKKYLLQPLDMLGYLIVYRVAHKIAYIATSFIPYAILFALCGNYFEHFPDATTFAAYLLSLLLAFAVGFYFEACIGMVGFWLLEVTSLLYIVNTLNYFISGHMFPIDLLPEPAPTILKLLPFQYMAYFPATVFLGKVEGAALWQGLVAEAAWALGLMVLSRTLFRIGLRRYSAYGG
jgi:viologen exporter family transport system permease protein